MVVAERGGEQAIGRNYQVRWMFSLGRGVGTDKFPCILKGIFKAGDLKTRQSLIFRVV